MIPTLKYKVVHGRCSDDANTMGQYTNTSKVIEIFVDTIKRMAHHWNCSYQDLRQMVVLHEECHVKNDHLGLSTPQDEQLADQYAFWRFIKEMGRWPDVPTSKWFQKEYV